MHKQLKFILLLLGIGLAFNLQSQTNNSFKRLNDSMYNLEQNLNYQGVIQLSNLALKKNVDYYYLRMKLGNAYFNTGKYQQAYYQYYKAYLFNKSSVEAISKMRDCTLLNGQNSLNNYFKPSLGIANQKIQKIYLETGTKLSNRTDSIQHTYFAHLGLGINIKKQIESYQGYTYCSQKSSLYDVVQHQYIGLVNMILNPTFQLKLGFSYLNATVDNHLLNEQTQISNFTEAIAINKQLLNFNFGIDAAICRLNKKEQWQLGATVNYSPTGNDKLNLQFHGILQNQDNHLHLIYNPSFYCKLGKNLWLIGAYTYANSTNYIEQEGFIVNNNYDNTKDKFSVMLNFKTSKNKDLYLCYQFENKSRKYSYPEIQQTYSFNNIIIGYTLKN